MKIRTANTEFPVVKIVSEAMKKGVYTYPALKIVLPDSIPAEYVSEILSGKFDIIDDMGNVAMTYEGYKTLKEISITVGRITTADERVEELESELETTQAEHAEMKESVNLILPKLDDQTALTVKHLYPTFADSIGRVVKEGFRFTYYEKLFKTIQPEMTLAEHYPPGVGMESLYTEICETHLGTMDDPIPYSGNMELEAGKYYIENEILYLCTRNSEIKLTHSLADLVEQYVEIYTE
jgi:hypothetical protein